MRKDKDFNLFVTPPKKIVKPNKETLKTLSMLPYSILYFEWIGTHFSHKKPEQKIDPTVNAEGYIAPEVIEKYKSELKK